MLVFPRIGKPLRGVAVLAVLLLVWSASVRAQEAPKNWAELGTSSEEIRDLALLLRGALSSDNALAALRPHISFPLEIHLDGETQILHRGRDLAAVWEKLATEPLVTAITNLDPELMVGVSGGIETEAGHLRILSVCSEGCRRRLLKVASFRPLGNQSPLPRPVYTCNADRRTYRVEEVQETGLRLRSWSSQPDGRPVTLHSSQGKLAHKSSGSCSQRVWSFKEKETSWRLETLGCEDTTEAPLDAVGRIAQLRGFEPTFEAWCQLGKSRR